MARYPDELLYWAGHRVGGVRRLFDNDSGRPGKKLIRTALLARLESWSEGISQNRKPNPRIILLVGGPGNGKTEAVEECIRHLDSFAGISGKLTELIAQLFAPGSGKPMPRIVTADLAALTNGRTSRKLSIVQDASVIDEGHKGLSPAKLFLSDVAKFSDASCEDLYVACINRGVIDEALAQAIDTHDDAARSLLENVIRAVGLTSDAPSAWPLEGAPDVAVWPMDVETLLAAATPASPSPAEQLLEVATAEESWPKEGGCPASERCPFCFSRKLLSQSKSKDGLLKLLRWYELASGKRWNFRDLGSLISHVLSNVPVAHQGEVIGPCQWAATMLEIDEGKRASSKRRKQESLYIVVSALYQHALFGEWPKAAARSLRSDIRTLGLEENSTLMGLYHFLSGQRARSIPATLEPQLKTLSDLLDPALADPDEKVDLTTNTEIFLRDIDVRFSQSVEDGLAFLRRYRVLSSLEVDLLLRLADADKKLSDHSIRNKRPAAAARLQTQIRDFACRLVRRSIGVRVGVARDAAVLSKFQRLIDGDVMLMHEVAKEVERLLNEGDNFNISLNTTFGEPLPPPSRRSMLTTTKQRVRSQTSNTEGRPAPILRFLKVGPGASGQSVPLTFELFKSVQELSEGMLAAALPRTVVALLDTTRARLSGRIVRDEELLEASEIHIGIRPDLIGRELNQFVVRQRIS